MSFRGLYLMDADMIDSDVSRWILEFLIRQSIDDNVLHSLLRVLSLPNDNPSLKKSLLLRKIESEVSNGVVSEKTLTLLEQMEELDPSLEASNSLKVAYCSVAVDCTVRFLKNGSSNSVKGEYFDAVKSVWRRRVSNMEKFGNVGLVSEELLQWKDQIEAALWEESVCENVVKRSKGVNAVEAVRFYLDEEKGKIGPSFLEYVAETLELKGSDGCRALLGVIGLGKDQKSADVPAEAAALPSGGTVATDADTSREVPNGNLPPRRKHVAHKSTKGVASGAARGAKITAVEEMEVGASCNKYDVLATPEVNKVQQMLESSRLELQAVVKDPLPTALCIADSVVSGMARENNDQEPVAENQDKVIPLKDKNAGVDRPCEGNVGNGCCSDQTTAPKLSLMERNKTARTFEWDDSLDGSPDRRTRPQLPSPRRRPASPLRKVEVQNLMKRRRKKKRWSTLEEDTLRTGVQKYGVGNWKLILNSYRDIFEERTEVDLKDKWRNLVRCR